MTNPRTENRSGGFKALSCLEKVDRAQPGEGLILDTAEHAPAAEAADVQRRT